MATRDVDLNLPIGCIGRNFINFVVSSVWQRHIKQTSPNMPTIKRRDVWEKRKKKVDTFDLELILKFI